MFRLIGLLVLIAWWVWCFSLFWANVALGLWVAWFAALGC